MRFKFFSRFASVAFAMLVGCALAKAAESEYNLGVGAYREKNYAAAREHWSNAAEQGESSAFNNLGFLLYNGMGGAPDPARAVVLWRRAAIVGHAESQWHLAKALEVGKGEAANPVEAYAWYRCAARNFPDVADEEAGSEIAEEARQSVIRLIGTFTLDQLAPAEKLAREYIAKYPAKPELK